MDRVVKESQLVLRFANGFNEQNEPLYKDVTYSRVIESATDEAIKAVGMALAPLFSMALALVVVAGSINFTDLGLARAFTLSESARSRISDNLLVLMAPA